MQNEEKHRIEKEIMRDAFEEEAFEGLSKLNAEELEIDISELSANISERSRKTRKLIPVWFRYAASVIVLVGIGLTIIFLNSRYWQDSLLKEQVAKEMEVADSMEVEAAKQHEVTAQKLDTVKPKPEELIAKSKESKTAKKEKQEPVTQTIVEDKVVFDDIEVSEDDYEAEAIQEREIVAFEEEELFAEDKEMAMMPAKEVAKVSEDEKREEELVEAPENKEVSKVIEGKAAGVKVKSRKRIQKAANTSGDFDKATESKKTVIKGKIVSVDDDLSIPGVSVTVKDNPTIGTTTDMNGEFELNIPSDEELEALVASFVGMKSQEIDIGNDTNLLVYMEPDVLEMDEVIVTAVGSGSEYDDEGPTKVSAKPPKSLNNYRYKKVLLEKIDESKLSHFPGKHKIKVSFTVGESGELYNFNFGNIPDIAFSNEIKKAILEIGKWQPATLNDATLESIVEFTLKIDIEE
jgi:hypothetical protein